LQFSPPPNCAWSAAAEAATAAAAAQRASEALPGSKRGAGGDAEAHALQAKARFQAPHFPWERQSTI